MEAAEGLIGTEGAAPVVEHLERYLAKMGTASPLPPEQRRFFGADEAMEMKAVDLERALASGAVFSAKAAKVMTARLTGAQTMRHDHATIARIIQVLENAGR